MVSIAFLSLQVWACVNLKGVLTELRDRAIGVNHPSVRFRGRLTKDRKLIPGLRHRISRPPLRVFKNSEGEVFLLFELYGVGRSSFYRSNDWHRSFNLLVDYPEWGPPRGLLATDRGLGVLGLEALNERIPHKNFKLVSESFDGYDQIPNPDFIDFLAEGLIYLSLDGMVYHDFPVHIAGYLLLPNEVFERIQIRARFLREVRRRLGDSPRLKEALEDLEETLVRNFDVGTFMEPQYLRKGEGDRHRARQNLMFLAGDVEYVDDGLPIEPEDLTSLKLESMLQRLQHGANPSEREALDSLAKEFEDPLWEPLSDSQWDGIMDRLMQELEAKE